MKTAPTPPERRMRLMAVSGVMQAVLGRSGGREILQLTTLLPHWRNIVPSLHTWCWPVALQRGVLRVAVTSASVRQQLQYETPTILHMLGMVLGDGVVKNLAFVMQQAKPDVMRGAEKKPVAAQAEDIAKAQVLCQGVGDDDLRDALTALGAHVLGQTKTTNR